MRFDIAGCFTNKRGNIATMTALPVPVFLAVAAIGVDLSSLCLERQSLQSLADIASICASTNVARASQSVMAHLHDNGVDAVLMVGTYDPSLIGRPVVSAKGTAMANKEASFSIGSRLTSVNGGTLNASLVFLFGTSISL